jgi:hypothetical protein
MFSGGRRGNGNECYKKHYQAARNAVTDLRAQE